MTLSICCLTDAPGAQIRAMLQPLREVADEIVIAADQRVDPADVSAYGTIADRVLRFEFEFLEAHLAWLHAECAGDWVFRLDGDEEASPELIDVLPELIATPDVRQYWFPRRWLDSSGRGMARRAAVGSRLPEPARPERFQPQLRGRSPHQRASRVSRALQARAFLPPPLPSGDPRGEARARPVLRDPEAAHPCSRRRVGEREVLPAGALRAPPAKGAVSRAIDPGIALRCVCSSPTCACTRAR